MQAPSPVVYVARYPWLFRLIALVGVGMFAVLRPNVIETWQAEGWFFGLGLMAVYLLIALAVLETFVRRTTFTNAGVHQRSMFGFTRFIAYSHIRELTIRRGEALILKSENGRSVKIHAKEGDPEVIIEAMRPFLDPETRVVTV